MTPPAAVTADRLRVFIDSDVLIAGSASEGGASFVVLHLAGLTLIDCFISRQVQIEVTRNLTRKLPGALPAFRTLVESALQIVPDPSPQSITACHNQADPKDVPILAAAVESQCRFLLTFNTRHFRPTGEIPTVLRPGTFLGRLREYTALLE